MPTYGIALAHVEEFVDRVSVALDQMANGVAEWRGEPGAVLEEPALPPEARALRWHLQAGAANLRTSEAACSASRDWTRPLLAAAAACDRDGPIARRAASG